MDLPDVDLPWGTKLILPINSKIFGQLNIDPSLKRLSHRTNTESLNRTIHRAKNGRISGTKNAGSLNGVNSRSLIVS